MDIYEDTGKINWQPVFILTENMHLGNLRWGWVTSVGYEWSLVTKRASFHLIPMRLLTVDSVSNIYSWNFLKPKFEEKNEMPGSGFSVDIFLLIRGSEITYFIWIRDTFSNTVNNMCQVLPRELTGTNSVLTVYSKFLNHFSSRSLRLSFICHRLGFSSQSLSLLTRL